MLTLEVGVTIAPFIGKAEWTAALRRLRCYPWAVGTVKIEPFARRFASCRWWTRRGWGGRRRRCGRRFASAVTLRVVERGVCTDRGHTTLTIRSTGI